MNMTMSLASAAAFALLHSLWELALIALLAWLSLALLRGASASARHAVGMLWLVAMAAAPVITFAVCWHAPTLLDAGAQGAALLAKNADAYGIGPEGLSPGGGWLLMCVAQMWLLGVLLMGVRQLGGWRAVRQIERGAFVPLPP